MTCNKLFLAGALFLSVISGATAANDLADLSGLALSKAKIPLYNKSQQQMQAMMFVDNAVVEGKVIIGKNTVLDIVRKGCNVDNIKDSWELKYYTLQSSLAEVVKFWAQRSIYSEGVVITEQANIDKDNKRVTGSSRVYFRSPLIDLDGIGFEANFDNSRTVLVNSDVNVILRMAASDPRKLAVDGVDKKDYSFVRAYSDSLLIDIKHNQIMLVGSVRVIDRSSVLTCDRLTIFLDDEKQKTSTPASGTLALEGDKGLSRILADGNVVVSNGKNANAARAVADHLIYDAKLGIFTFTGDRNNPRIETKQEVISGKKIVIYREEQQARIVGNCCLSSAGTNGSLRRITSDRGDIDFRINRGAFVGNVVVKDSGMEISGPRANLELASKDGKAETSNKKIADQMLPGGFGSEGFGGARELKSVEFTDGIRVKDVSAGKVDLAAENGKYNAAGKYMDFRKNVRLLDAQMTLNAGKMRIMLLDGAKTAERKANNPTGGIDRIICSKGVKIVGTGENAGTLTSENGVFHYKEDMLVFTDKVRLVNKNSTLDCDKLDLYLKSSANKTQTKQTGVVGVGGSDKVLTKAVATGDKVVMNDAQGNLVTKHLTLLFEELPKGSKPVPGMLQAGNSRLTWIACNDGVRVENINKTTSKGKSKNAIFGKSGSKRTVIADRSETDLKKNVAYLYDNVSVDDGNSRIECQKMSLFADAPEKKKVVASELDIDADPFALSAGEDSVPRNIMLSPDLELKRVLFERDVVLSSSDRGKKVSVGGDTGEFLSSTRKMVVSANPPDRAWLRGEGRLQKCDKIIFDVDQERIYGVGPTVTERDFEDKKAQ